MSAPSSPSAPDPQSPAPAPSTSRSTESGATVDEAAQGSAPIGADSLLETYHAIAEWIRFADAKAGVVLTVGGALAGLLVPTVKTVLEDSDTPHLIPFWKTVVLALFSVHLLLLLLSGVWAFRCIAPMRRRGRHPSLDHCPHFHPAAISARYGIDEPERFAAGLNEARENKFRDELTAAILFDAHISSAKYGRVTAAIQLFAASALFALLYLVSIQF